MAAQSNNGSSPPFPSQDVSMTDQTHNEVDSNNNSLQLELCPVLPTSEQIDAQMRQTEESEKRRRQRSLLLRDRLSNNDGPPPPPPQVALPPPP
jgi:hypothetical protein